jgi:hypothetical protein
MKPCKYFNSYKKYILNVANEVIPSPNKRKYSYDYYLTHFNIVLANGIKWQCLEIDGTALHHWKTIYNEFNKWSKHDIFEIAWRRFMINNYHNINHIRKSRHFKVFIDVTKINNKGGVEGIVINNEYQKKNITPVTILCDDKKLPVSVNTLKCKTTYKSGRKSCSHDVTGVQDALCNIPMEIPNYIKISLTGDKGYISQKEYNILNNNQAIKITAPNRRNQDLKTSPQSKKLLQERYKVEHAINNLKSKTKISNRTDRRLFTYLSFIYLSFINSYFEYITNNDIAIKIL